jgi:putative polyhydroxyalkanoate system protein
MASIDIKRSHSLGKDAARQKAEELARNLESRMGIQWRWEGDAIQFDAPSGAAKGTKGHVHVSDSEVRVTVELPMMLRMMKGMIEGKVKEKLEQLV